MSIETRKRDCMLDFMSAPNKTLQEIILQECENTEFKKARLKYPYHLKESTQTKSKLCRFHKGYKHNNDECISMKDTIKDLI